jgi:hypothetical protein
MYDLNVRRIAWLFFSIACAVAQPPRANSSAPTPAAQRTLIARMREAALNYGDRLQDFTCTQLTERFTDNESNGKHWKHIDNLEHQVDFVSHRERYRLQKVNGKTTDLGRRLKKGYFQPGGEFGSRLRKIFEPDQDAEFLWDRDEQIGGRRACVFRYRIPEATSTMAMQVDLESVTLGHHGFVHADCETGTVLRIEMETDRAWVHLGGRRSEIGAQVDLRYGTVTISGKEFLVPLEAVEIARFDRSLTKADIKFKNYRKYDADSSIKFETGEGKPQ